MNLAQLSPQSTPHVLYIGFNQDFGCFSVGTNTGFRIYNCDTFRESFVRDLDGPIGIVEMLFHCNILALVGGGKTPGLTPTKVMIWDDNQLMAIGEIAHRSEVRSVKLRRDKIVVCLDQNVYLYNFDLQMIRKYDTAQNPKGIVGLSPSPNGSVLCCPSIQKGHVRVADLTTGKEDFIAAHESPLSYIAINHDGSRIATASEKGTIIRVYNTKPGNGKQPVLMKEVRRGTHYTEIYSISFSMDSRFIVVSSGRGTIHIFDLGAADVPMPTEEESAEKNRKSTFGFLSSVSGYFGSEWSLAWYKGPDVPCICAFGQDNASVLVVASNGQFLRLGFHREKAGEMQCLESEIFCAGM
jgi:WD40 repeat protein